MAGAFQLVGGDNPGIVAIRRLRAAAIAAEVRWRWGGDGVGEVITLPGLPKEHRMTYAAQQFLTRSSLVSHHFGIT